MLEPNKFLFSFVSLSFSTIIMQCCFCEKYLDTYRLYCSHVRLHSIDRKFKKPLICNINKCPFKCSTYASFYRHTRTSHKYYITLSLNLDMLIFRAQYNILCILKISLVKMYTIFETVYNIFILI